MSVSQTSVCISSVDKMSIDKIYIDKIYIDKMSLDKMTHCQLNSYILKEFLRAAVNSILTFVENYGAKTLVH
jgi:hypothetical protein